MKALYYEDEDGTKGVFIEDEFKGTMITVEVKE